MDLDKYNKRISMLFSKCNFAGLYDFREKENAVFLHNADILNRTQQMFEYDGLPETITKRNLELMLQIHGYAGIVKVEGKLYAMYGGLGGEPNEYYMPTILTVSNPYLNYTANLKIDTDCIIIPNDSLYLGLLPILTRYNTLITETELSLKIALVNSRIVDLISAGDDRTYESAVKFLNDMEDGKQGVVAENQFLEGIKAQPYAGTGNSNNITSIIEALQYARASLYNDIGLSANFNMKREALNSAESAINNDILLPLVDDMLQNRKDALEKVNQMFDTNITVRLSSSWEDNQQEVEQELDEQKEPEKEEPEQEPEEREDTENEQKETE